MSESSSGSNASFHSGCFAGMRSAEPRHSSKMQEDMDHSSGWVELQEEEANQDFHTNLRSSQLSNHTAGFAGGSVLVKGQNSIIEK